MEPNEISIGADDVGETAPPPPPSWVPNKIRSDQDASKVPSLQHGQSFSSEGESMDSLSEKAMISSPKSEHSFMDSGNDDDSTLGKSLTEYHIIVRSNPAPVLSHQNFTV